MKLINNIKNIKTNYPPYYSLSVQSSYEEIYLWEVGYQDICSINNNMHILKDMTINENIQVTDDVYKYLLSIGESINNSY